MLNRTATAAFEMATRRFHAVRDGGDDTCGPIGLHLDLFAGQDAFKMHAVWQKPDARLIQFLNYLAHYSAASCVLSNPPD